MKNMLKIVFVGVVILGLVASYVFLAPPSLNRQSQQADTGASFSGPTGEPFTNGPTEPPPTTQ